MKDTDELLRQCDQVTPAILGYLRRWGLQHADAEDQLQEGWVRLLRSGDNVENPAAFFTRVIQNLGGDFYRNKGREIRKLGNRCSDSVLLAVEDSQDEPFEQLALREALDEFQRASNREVFAAVYLTLQHGFSRAEVAAHLGVSERTIRRRLAAGRVLLAPLLH